MVELELGVIRRPATSTEFEECDHRFISWLDSEYWSCLSCGDMFYEGPPLEGW